MPGFLGFANLYSLRVNLSVAIVAMVNSSYVHSGETNVSDGTCGGDEASSTTTSGGHFNWDEATQVGITRKYDFNLTT